MSVMTNIALSVFNPINADGTLRGANMGEAQIWGTEIEYLANLAYTSSLVYSTRAALYANLVPAANTPALVIGDPTAGYDGLYMKVGATTTGSWTRLGDVPGYSFIKATDVGAGTPNAIIATSTAIPAADGGALIALNIFETNTASPVTVAFNGGSALTIKTNAGNDVAVGGLTAGMIVAGYVSGSTFRLLSDQASAAIQAAAEAAQAAAEAAAASVVASKFNSQANAAAATISALTDFIEVGGLVYQRITATHPRLGPEIAINGAFASDTGWTKGTGWTISGGAAVATAGAQTEIYQNRPSIITGRKYLAVYDLTRTGGDFAVSVGATYGVLRTATGQYSQVLSAGGNTFITVIKGTDGAGTVDNVSVKELPSDAFSSNGGTVWWAQPWVRDNAAMTDEANTFTATQTFTTASSATTVVKLESTSADATGGPQLDILRNSVSPAANDVIGIIRARGMNSAASEVSYANIYTTILDPTAGSEDGRLILQVSVAGAQTDAASIANGMIVGAPTGSYQGTGTINATGYYINGVALSSSLFGVTPGATGLALLDDTTAAAGRTTLGLGTAAVKNTGTSGDAVPLLNGANTWSESQILGLTVGAAGDRFEIQKIASPVSYATTKASFVIQHYEDNGGANLANGSKVDNVLLHVTERTQGVTTSSTNSSVITGQGWRAYIDKENDGSAHCFTATGVLGPNGVDNAKAGANGYNELGGFQALLQNTGSSNGYISAVEVHVKDSADAGVNDYPTRMTGVAAGLAKYNASAEPSYNFHAINEGSTGSLDLDAILFADHRNNGAWKRGIDLYDDGTWDFATLVAVQIKEANKIRWTDGTNNSDIYANANGKIVLDPAGAQVFVTEGGALATPGLAKDDDPNTGLLWNAADDFQIVAGGVSRIRALNNNLQLALGAGALKTVTEGAADSGGAGFKLLRVPN